MQKSSAVVLAGGARAVLIQGPTIQIFSPNIISMHEKYGSCNAAPCSKAEGSLTMTTHCPRQAFLSLASQGWCRWFEALTSQGKTHLKSSSYWEFFSFSVPSGTKATPNLAVRVGYTLSYMSAPRAEQITMSRG